MSTPQLTYVSLDGASLTTEVVNSELEVQGEYPILARVDAWTKKSTQDLFSGAPISITDMQNMFYYIKSDDRIAMYINNVSMPEDNLSLFDSKIACLCQSIKINNNKHVYHQSQVWKPIGNEVKWAECSFITGTGCWVQFILDTV